MFKKLCYILFKQHTWNDSFYCQHAFYCVLRLFAAGSSLKSFFIGFFGGFFEGFLAFLALVAGIGCELDLVRLFFRIRWRSNASSFGRLLGWLRAWEWSFSLWTCLRPFLDRHFCAFLSLAAFFLSRSAKNSGVGPSEYKEFLLAKSSCG